MAELRVEGLVKMFGAIRAVDNISFTVADGEFLTLLGPSGCGKSTTLAAIAGLDRSDEGRIVLGDHLFFDGARGVFVPPERREVGLVFQSYALWPHMTVAENLDFPLRLRKMPRAQRAERVAEALALVEMSDYGARYPFAALGRSAAAGGAGTHPGLSPQPAAAGRAAVEPGRQAAGTGEELAAPPAANLRVTTVYVTHDQSEALALSDRIAVMNGGKIVQLADPHTIYERPADPFVADFIGSSNFLPGIVAEADDATRARQADRLHRPAAPAGTDGSRSEGRGCGNGRGASGADPDRLRSRRPGQCLSGRDCRKHVPWCAQPDPGARWGAGISRRGRRRAIGWVTRWFRYRPRHASSFPHVH